MPKCLVYLTVPANSEDDSQAIIDRAKELFPKSYGWYEKDGVTYQLKDDSDESIHQEAPEGLTLQEAVDFFFDDLGYTFVTVEPTEKSDESS